MTINATPRIRGYCRYNNKRQQYRPKSFPSDIASHSPHDDSRGGHGQKSRESCGLAVCRQEEWQHRHNEDAKAEASSALHKTGSDAQQEYGYNKATHLLSILPMLSDGQRYYFRFLLKKSASLSQGMRFFGSPLPTNSV